MLDILMGILITLKAKGLSGVYTVKGILYVRYTNGYTNYTKG